MHGRTRKGLSYVLREIGEDENHILPINAIQFSSRLGKFYTGGRDGTVKQWSSKNSLEPTSLGTPNQFNFKDEFESQDSNNYEVDLDVDERALKLETAIASNPLAYSLSDYEDFNITKNFDIHFDWINDIKLVDYENSLVTCSSDLSLKLINLHVDESMNEQAVHKFDNVHTDYIQKISYNFFENQIFSGGLDGKICMWDLNTLRPLRTITDHSSSHLTVNSVYSIANNYKSLVAAGGPSSIINLYDKRQPDSSCFIKKLVGHQDNIRCLLMNENFILSGSSDTTIKLWDLRNFKVYKNFGMHDDAVWSLTTGVDSSFSINQHDCSRESHFRHFYSGDKGGNVIKTDLSYVFQDKDTSEKNDYFSFSDTEKEAVDDLVGLSVLVAKIQHPAISLCVEVDSTATTSPISNSLLVSTYHSLNRYHIPDTERLAEYQYISACFDYQQNHVIGDDEGSIGLSEVVDDQNDLDSEFHDLVSQFSNDTYSQDIQSSFSSPNIAIANPSIDNTTAGGLGSEPLKSMFYSTLGGPSKEFFNYCGNDTERREIRKSNEFLDNTPIEISLNPIAEDQVEFIPFNIKPFNSIPLVAKSVISKRLLSNKRQLIALYLNGDIKVWDILTFKVVRTFSSNIEDMNLITKEFLENRTKEMDEIYLHYQSNEVLPSWCEIEVKAGKLLVTLRESNCNTMEIFYDELCKAYPNLALRQQMSQEAFKGQSLMVQDDTRFPIAQILLNSLFLPYVRYEWNFDEGLRESLRISLRENRKLSLSSNDEDVASLNSSSNVTETSDNSILNSAVKRIKMFSRKSFKGSASQQGDSGNSGLIKSGHEGETLSIKQSTSKILRDFIHKSSDENKNELDNSVMTILQANKRKYLESYAAFGTNKVLPSHLKIYSNNKSYSEGQEENQVYKPLIKSNEIPNNLLIIISEYSSDLGNMRDVFSFHFEDLLKLTDTSADPDPDFVKDIRTKIPYWIGEVILLDKFTMKETPKIEFLLKQVDLALLPVDKRIGGKSQKKIKKLPAPETPFKLSSHGMLRVLKLLAYLVDKFESRTTEMKDALQPSDWLVLECKGQELPPQMTLQTIKTKIWKSSSEIDLQFRRKFDT